MAKQIEVTAVSGESGVTCDLFPIGSQTATESGIALTEDGTKTGHYLGTVTAAAAEYDCVVKYSDGAVANIVRRYIGSTDPAVYSQSQLEIIADDWADGGRLDLLLDGVNTDSDTLLDDVAWALTLLAGTISTAGTDSETFDLTHNGTAYRVVVTSTDDSGNRTGQTLSKP